MPTLRVVFTVPKKTARRTYREIIQDERRTRPSSEKHGGERPGADAAPRVGSDPAFHGHRRALDPDRTAGGPGARRSEDRGGGRICRRGDLFFGLRNGQKDRNLPRRFRAGRVGARDRLRRRDDARSLACPGRRFDGKGTVRRGARLRARGARGRGLPDRGQTRRRPRQGRLYPLERRRVRALHNLRHPDDARQNRRTRRRNETAPRPLFRRRRRRDRAQQARGDQKNPRKDRGRRGAFGQGTPRQLPAGRRKGPDL